MLSLTKNPQIFRDIHSNSCRWNDMMSGLTPKKSTKGTKWIEESE